MRASSIRPILGLLNHLIVFQKGIFSAREVPSGVLWMRFLKEL
jgi:hypothetical protein